MKKPTNVNVLVLWILAGAGGIFAGSLYLTVAWNLFVHPVFHSPTLHVENGLGLLMLLALLMAAVFGLKETKSS